MAWTYLAFAAIFEIAFALGMKSSNGFTKLLPTGLTVVGAVGGIFFLTMAMKSIPVSLAYPIWTAAGAVGTVILGYVWFGENLSPLKIAGLTAIVLGVTSLRASAA